MVDVNMSGSPEYQKWKKATVTKIEMWNGQVSGYSLKTDEGAELLTSIRYLRRLTTEHQNNNQNITIPNHNVDPAKTEETQLIAQFKVGDRVEVDKIMAKDPKDSRWGKATVKAIDLPNQRYIVRLDENFIDISILMRPGKNWIRTLNDGSRLPEQGTCSFTEPAGTVSKTSPPSAQLFKRVIYDWQNSVKRGSRLGITFEKFEMGKPYKNVLTQKGRLLDFLPTNAIIYPVKTKQIVCEEHTTLIRRTTFEMGYACYKNEYGDWVCKNGAPQKMELKSIYKE
jgi:hypothetical protein